MTLNLNKFRMGTFILWMNEGEWVGNTIEKAQLEAGFSVEHSKFVHIDVSGGGPNSIRVNPPITKNVDIRKTYPGRAFLVVRYKNVVYQAKKRYKVAYWAATNCNLKYDFWDILRFKIPFLPTNKKLYFCSENALWALQEEFPKAMNFLKPDKCMPAHFLGNEFEVVYGGRIPNE